MTMPSERQITWLAETMAARMLADAAADPRRDQLDQALRFWFPSGDLTQLQIIEIRGKVQDRWRRAAGALTERRERYVELKRAEPLPGCDGRV